MTKKQKYNNQTGFTLIEAAIVILIVSMTMIPVFSFMNYKRTVDNQKDMSVNYERIITSLEIYLKQNGHYPCPANITLSVGEANFGKGDVDGDGNCAGAGVNPANDVFRGAVPTSDLNLPFRLAGNYDGWKLHYTVDKAQTTEANYNGSGNITIRDKDNKDVAVNVMYVVTDPGMDGKGSYSMFGGAGPSCVSSSSDDSENCDDDRTFIDADKTDLFDTSSGDFYDDTIYFQRAREDSGFWMTQRNPGNLSGLNIVNRNPGNIGIGVDAPTEKVEVGGDVRIENDGAATNPKGGSLDVEMSITAIDINAENEVIIHQDIKSPRFTYDRNP